MRAEKVNGPQERAEWIESKTGQRKVSNSDGESQPINPASIASERAIIGAIMEDDDLVMPCVLESGLRSTDFFLSNHRRIFDAVLQLWQEARHVDMILVTERLGNKIEDAVVVA